MRESAKKRQNSRIGQVKGLTLTSSVGYEKAGILKMPDF